MNKKLHLQDCKETDNESEKVLSPSFTQLLPANGKVLLISDVGR